MRTLRALAGLALGLAVVLPVVLLIRAAIGPDIKRFGEGGWR